MVQRSRRIWTLDRLIRHHRYRGRERLGTWITKKERTGVRARLATATATLQSPRVRVHDEAYLRLQAAEMRASHLSIRARMFAMLHRGP